MKSDNARRVPVFKVVCTWCGALIRDSSVKDSPGMCPDCYARLLNEHFRPQRASAAPHASDR